MPFTVHLDHDQRLAVFRAIKTLSQDELTGAMKVFRHPDFPPDYDVLNLYGGVTGVAIDHDAVVRQAIERQRTLIEREPGRPLRSAFVEVPPQVKALIEYWPLFFPESDNSLLIRFFDTLEDALDWLGRAPIRFDQLEAFEPDAPR